LRESQTRRPGGPTIAGMAGREPPTQGAWQGAPLPLSGSRIPTMISPEETQYLWWLTATEWRDAGHIVEIGPWLGGSTVCLAEGMRARLTPPAHRLHTVDNFVWRSFMAERADLGLRPGESFEAAFRANVEPYADLIEVERAWLPDERIEGDAWAEDVRGDGNAGALFRWDGAPIELAFVDGAKSWTAFAHLMRELGPSLAEGSLLVLQDYKYWGSYWVPMLAELQADRLELVHVLPHNTVGFRVTRDLGPLADAIAMPAPAEGVALLERAADRLVERGDRLGAEIVRLESIRFLAHRGDGEGAARLLRERVRAWPASADARDLLLARAWLETFSGRSIRSSSLTARALRNAARRRAGRAVRIGRRRLGRA